MTKTFSAWATTVLEHFENWAHANIFSTDFAVQLGVIATSALIAYFGHRWMKPRATRQAGNWSLSATSKRLIDAGAALIGVFLFLALLLLAHTALQQTEPSLKRGTLRIALNLASAWALIRFFSNLLADQLSARIVAWIAWIIAALNILDLLDPLTRLLGSIGIPLGASRITLLTILTGLMLLAALLWAAFLISAHVERTLQTTTALSPRVQVLVGKITRFILITVAGVVALGSVGVNMSALATFTGALGVGIGIGLQRQVSNLVSGLLLLLDKSIKPGDVIEVGDTYGSVREMSARYVGVLTRDNKEILIPNDEFIVNQMVNWSHNDRNLRIEVKFGVSYDADPHRVRELAVAAARVPTRVSKQLPPVCHLTGFGDSAIDFVLRFWIVDPEAGVTNIKGEVLLALWDAFKANAIEIPFPHRYVIMAGDKSGHLEKGPLAEGGANLPPVSLER